MPRHFIVQKDGISVEWKYITAVTIFLTLAAGVIVLKLFLVTVVPVK
jgi:hypothetical protein